jgi:hypothetical protein
MSSARHGSENPLQILPQAQAQNAVLPDPGGGHFPQRALRIRLRLSNRAHHNNERSASRGFGRALLTARFGSHALRTYGERYFAQAFGPFRAQRAEPSGGYKALNSSTLPLRFATASSTILWKKTCYGEGRRFLRRPIAYITTILYDAIRAGVLSGRSSQTLLAVLGTRQRRIDTMLRDVTAQARIGYAQNVGEVGRDE